MKDCKVENQLNNINLKYYCDFFFSNLLIYYYFIIVYYSIFRGSKNKRSMDPVHILIAQSMDKGGLGVYWEPKVTCQKIAKNRKTT